MRVAALYEYDQEVNVRLKLEEVHEPTVNAPDEVIVRIGAAGLCCRGGEDMYCDEGVFFGLATDGGFAKSSHQ